MYQKQYTTNWTRKKNEHLVVKSIIMSNKNMLPTKNCKKCNKISIGIKNEVC